jgi:TonB family protein
MIREPVTQSGIPPSATLPAPPAESTSAEAESGYVTVHFEGVTQVPTFLIEQRQQRMGGALGVSMLTHAAFIVLVIWLIRLTPSVLPDSLPDFTNVGLVFLNIEGPGGGGGGGGNKSPDPPPKAELPGKEKLTVEVAKTPAPRPLEPKPEPPQQELVLPVLSVRSGADTLPGEVLAPPAPVVTTSQGSGTGSGAGTGRGAGSGEGTGSGLGPGTGGGFGGGAYQLGAGIEPPRVRREVRPKYTNDAMRAKIMGQVEVEVVVLADGTVGQARVVRSLDSTFGLDDEALKAARLWRFEPAKRQGVPVPVIARIVLNFSIW